MGNPKGSTDKRYTADEVAQAIRKAGGFLTLAAQNLGCSRVTVWRYCRDFATCKEAQDDARERTKDLAEGNLLQLIRAGNVTAIIFYLKTQAKDRGYVERQELSGPAGAPVSVTYSIDDWKAKRAGRLQEAERTVEMFDDEDTDA